MKTSALLITGVLFAFHGHTAPANAHWSGQMAGEETMASDSGIVLEAAEKLVSPDLIRPPVEITIVAKTDSTNLRIGYAADQVIFNWEGNMDQLRVDGGPAGSRQVDGAGRIPKNKFVTIKWSVTPEHQAVYVDGRLRFENCGNYAKIDAPVSIFPACGSSVTVKSITIKQE
jgi:hypothetical protein